MFNDKEELRCEWQKLLIDCRTNEKTFCEQHGLPYVSTNRKIKSGTIPLLVFADYLHKLGYDLQIVKKENP